jgi:hypothetical protein
MLSKCSRTQLRCVAWFRTGISLSPLLHVVHAARMIDGRLRPLLPVKEFDCSHHHLGFVGIGVEVGPQPGSSEHSAAC